MKNEKTFNYRAITALASLFSGIGLPFTGYLVHAYQEGQQSFPQHFSMAAHTVLGTLFLVFSVWHVIINRRALVKHIQGFVAREIPISRECFFAFGIVFGIAFLVVSHTFHGR